MTPARREEIRRLASEWEFDKRIPAHRAARLLRELLGRVDELERGIGQMRLLAGLPLPPDVVAKLAEADRLRRLRNSMESDERLRAVRKLLEENGCECPCDHHPDERGSACEVCLACRIGEAVGK